MTSTRTSAPFPKTTLWRRNAVAGAQFDRADLRLPRILRFFENGVLMGVPDYVPPQVAEGPVRVTPTAFGGFGEGLLNVSRVKTGPATLFRLAHAGGRYCLHAVFGAAESPPAWEEAGWQPPQPPLPSLRINLDTPMPEFQQKVMGQHYIWLTWRSAARPGRAGADSGFRHALIAAARAGAQSVVQRKDARLGGITDGSARAGAAWPPSSGLCPYSQKNSLKSGAACA